MISCFPVQNIKEKNFVVAKDASSPLRVSWLKFEPKVSNFPLIKSDVSDFITASTKFFL